MKLTVNGLDVDVDDRHADTPLLWVLREVLDMRGTKFGCGAGFCAACTVLIDGRNVKSCQTVTERAVGKSVTTVEGASGPIVNAVRDAWHVTITPSEDGPYIVSGPTIDFDGTLAN